MLKRSGRCFLTETSKLVNTPFCTRYKTTWPIASKNIKEKAVQEIDTGILPDDLYTRNRGRKIKIEKGLKSTEIKVANLILFI